MTPGDFIAKLLLVTLYGALVLFLLVIMTVVWDRFIENRRRKRDLHDYYEWKKRH